MFQFISQSAESLLASLLAEELFILESSNEGIVHAEVLNVELRKSSKLNQCSINLKEGEENVFKT